MNMIAKTLSAFLLGAALVTPALAQDAASANIGAAAQDNAQAADTNASSAGNSQMAMNSTGNAADLSSVPDVHKKYSRATRAKDFRKEARVTAQLNQKESSLNGATAE